MTPVSRNEPRDQLAALLAEQLYDRGEYVADWPEDERELHRNGFPDAWTDFRSRTEAVQKLRYKKAADAVIAFTGGWRPPPRVIETPENEGDYTAAIAALDTLPRRAIVQVRNHVFQSIGSGWWETVGRHRAFSTEQIVDVADGDSVVVLWEPEETAGEPHRIDVTHVAPGELERMARSGARPSPELRAAIDRARDRKGPDRG